MTISGFDMSQHDKQILWTPEEDAILREQYPNTHTEILVARLGRPLNGIHHRATRLGIRKDKEWVRRTASENGKRSTNAGRFRKGQTPFNKGLKGVNGSSPSRFKPGHRPQTWVPIGTERLTSEGYLERKVRDARPAHKNFVAVHVLVWEAAHGPVPKGHAVVFRDGNRSRIELDNLEMITRRELMARNTVHRYPEEIKTAIRTKARLTRVINAQEKTREKQTD